MGLLSQAVKEDSDIYNSPLETPVETADSDPVPQTEETNNSSNVDTDLEDLEQLKAMSNDEQESTPEEQEETQETANDTPVQDVPMDAEQMTN